MPKVVISRLQRIEIRCQADFKSFCVAEAERRGLSLSEFTLEMLCRGMGVSFENAVYRRKKRAPNRKVA